MNNNFNLQKYLIENKLTTNSKLLKEIVIEPEEDTGRKSYKIIEVKLTFAGGEVDEITEHETDTQFETYCYRRGEQILEDVKGDFEEDLEDYEDYTEEFSIGEPEFNEDRNACGITASEDTALVIIVSDSLQENIKAKLLAEETPEDEIYDIMYSLGIDNI